MENRFLFLSTTFYCWVNEHYLSAPSAFWIPCCRYVRTYVVFCREKKLLRCKEACTKCDFQQRSYVMLWKVVFHVINFKWALKMLHFLCLKHFQPPQHWCVWRSNEYWSFKLERTNTKCKTIFLFPNLGDNAISNMTKKPPQILSFRAPFYLVTEKGRQFVGLTRTLQRMRIKLITHVVCSMSGEAVFPH